MDHLDVPRFLGLLALMLAAAKILGFLAERIGQPAVLGELVAGVLIGKTALGWVDPQNEILHLLSELGVVILLFSIGLETDLKSLLKVGPASAAVAIVGVVLPFFLGYLTCLMLRLNHDAKHRGRGRAHGHKRRDHGARLIRSRSTSKPRKARLFLARRLSTT